MKFIRRPRQKKELSALQARREAVAQAIQAEAQTQGTGVSKTTMDINRQCAEILKFIAEKL
jgi:hypothetical protein